MQQTNNDDLTTPIQDREAVADGGQNISDKDADGAKSADNEACEGREGEQNADTPDDETVPVYEQVGWKEKVQEFLRQYPIAKDFAADIGREIASSKELSNDPSCLEKALALTLANQYVSPEKLIADEEFLQRYVLSNQAVKDRIIQSYFDELQQNKPPKSISTRGQTTLTPPSKPKSIAEAGSVIKAMLNNRRI